MVAQLSSDTRLLGLDLARWPAQWRAAGQWLLRRRPNWLAGDVPAAMQPLAVLGRWSLSFYMLHQPLLIGALLGGRSLGWW